MATITPWKQKADERASLVKAKLEKQESPEPPPKKGCTVYEKQMSKLPEGDLQLVKDLVIIY